MSKQPVHLDAGVLQALLGGDLSPERERRLARHLATDDCARCDAFLEGMEAGHEQQLLRVLERVELASDLPGGARRQVLERAATRPLFARRWLVPVTGLALLVLAGTAASLALLRDETSSPARRVKGDPAAVGVELGLGLVETDAGGAKRIVRIGPGAVVAPGSMLVFRVDTRGPCYLYLVELGPAGAPALLLPDDPARPLRHAGGVYTPSGGKEPAGVRIRGPEGRRWFAAVCAPRPLALPGDLGRLAERLRAGAGPAQDVVSCDVVDVQVTGRDPQP